LEPALSYAEAEFWRIMHFPDEGCWMRSTATGFDLHFVFNAR
jgi:hypothetical protein